MAPIIRAEIPDIAPGEGVAANGDPVVCPREAARQAVEDERIRVLRYQEVLLERRELEEVRYDPNLDYSFLEVCKNGEYYNNSLKPKNILLTSNLQDRASVGRNKPPAALATSLGARRSGHLLSTSKEIERGMLIPTTEVKIKLNKNPKNSKLILNTFQEEEVVEEVATTATMTEEATTSTSEGEVANEEDVIKAVIHKPNDAQVHRS